MKEGNINLGELLDRLNDMVNDEDYLKGINLMEVGISFHTNTCEDPKDIGILAITLNRRQDNNGKMIFNIKLLANRDR